MTTILLLTTLSMVAFVATLMAESYVATFGVLISAFVGVTAYLIAKADFEGHAAAPTMPRRSARTHG